MLEPGRELNPRPTDYEGLAADSTLIFSDTHLRENALGCGTLENTQWLGFLSQWGMIEVSQGQGAITLKGRSFLVYVAHEGKSFERAG